MLEPRVKPSSSRDAFALHVAAWSSRLSLDAVPAPVRRKASLLLLDSAGCAIASIRSGELEPFVGSDEELTSTGAAIVIGTGRSVATDHAALLYGMAIHALDYDDTHPASYLHVSAPVVAAALAIAGERALRGADLLVALITGAETSIRLGEAAGQRMHRRGFHPTAVFGVVGATVAVSRLTGLTIDQTVSAIGISASMASGVMAYLNDGTDTKIVHPGWAALSAIWACRLALAGLTGPPSAIDGPKGLLAAHCPDHDTVRHHDLGSRWEIPNIAVKPYPVCHSAHASLDGIRQLRTMPDFDGGAIRRIVCSVPTHVVIDMVLEPAKAKLRPRTLYEGRFSLPWLIGVLLVRGDVGVGELSDERLLTDSRVIDVASKVTYVLEPLGPGHDLGATVAVEFDNGPTLTATILDPRGTTGNPLTEADVARKFDRNVNATDDRLRSILLDVERLESFDLSEVALLAAPPA